MVGGSIGRRSLVLAQHARLREVIFDVRSAANAVRTHVPPGADLVEQLRTFISILDGELHLHLATEEAVVEPVLSRIEGWGRVRLDLLRAEHAHQRAILVALRSPSLDPDALARRAVALADDLLADMGAEERDLLSPELISDDPIAPPHLHT
jgi:iron-sulfur cluster repair protein YtfE (RIC family)